MHFAVWVSVLQSTLIQLLSACGGREREREREREKVDAIFDLVPLDEALRWSLLGLGLDLHFAVLVSMELVRVRVRLVLELGSLS